MESSGAGIVSSQLAGARGALARGTRYRAKTRRTAVSSVISTLILGGSLPDAAVGGALDAARWACRPRRPGIEISESIEYCRLGRTAPLPCQPLALRAVRLRQELWRCAPAARRPAHQPPRRHGGSIAAMTRRGTCSDAARPDVRRRGGGSPPPPTALRMRRSAIGRAGQTASWLASGETLVATRV